MGLTFKNEIPVRSQNLSEECTVIMLENQPWITPFMLENEPCMTRQQLFDFVFRHVSKLFVLNL